VRRFRVPPEHLFDVIDGVETDLEPVRFATFADLYPYLYRVASAVGLACLPVWGFRPGVTAADAREPGEAAGVAFQLTNILRDLGEDRGRGRVYLPADELARFGCPPEAWPGGGFAEMLRFQADRARDYYRRGEPLAGMLTREGRAIFGAMAGTYRALLEAVAAAGPGVLDRRVRVPRWRKAWCFAAAWPVRWGWVPG
jgi:phytoene synthase